MHHRLKAEPDSFDLMAMRTSAVQLRKNDRDFRIEDTCTFYEWDPVRKFCTGRMIKDVPIITLLVRHEGLAQGWCLIVLDLPTSNISGFDADVTGITELPQNLGAQG